MHGFTLVKLGIFNRKFQEIYNQHQPKIWYMGLSEKGIYFEMISEIYREHMEKNIVKHSKNEIPNFQTPMCLHIYIHIYIYILLN